MFEVTPNMSIEELAKKMKYVANQGVFEGTHRTNYFDSCQWVIPQRKISMVFTRDFGAHTSGWKKNPEFEQCYHLSMSLSDKKFNARILKAIFGEHQNKLLIEPPHAVYGKRLSVWHYRLFCDPQWNPIIPKGEPYHTDNTPVDFKTFSEVQALKML